MADTIGTAYVQIEPSFQGVVPKIDKEFGGAGEKSGNSFGQGFAKVSGVVGKAALAAVTGASAAIAGVAKQATNSFANYEQLVGGVETLFGSSAGMVEDFANKAFATAGLSANKYMETVTSFSASLLQSVGGNTEEAAKIADRAIIDMSDNANKMGTSMESIQNAYQGFAKQNYTMLDNLKIGYGGTKEEMSRLIADASKMTDIQKELGVAVEEGDMSFANIANAISVVQKNLGIAGTTSKEASTTIQGSAASISAAWQNMLTGMASGEDLTPLIDNLVQTLITSMDNMIPVVEQSLVGIGQMLEGLAPIIGEKLPAMVSSILPSLLSAATSLVSSLVAALPSLMQTLVSAIPGVVTSIVDILLENLPMLVDVALQMIVTLADGIAQALPTLIPQITQVVLQIVDTLVNNIDMLIDVAIELIMALIDGVVQATPMLIEKFPEIILKIWEAIIRNLPKILQAAVELIMTLITGIVNNYAKVFEVGKQLIDKVKDGFAQKVQDAKNWGKDMIQNFIDGILAKWEDLKKSVSNLAQSVKDLLGFSEPKKGPLSNFHTYAPDMMELFAKGIHDNTGLVTSALNRVGTDVMNTGFNVNGIAAIGGTVEANVSSSDRLGVIENLLTQLIDASNRNIVLDTGALVGGTVAAYNQALGQISTRSSKR